MLTDHCCMRYSLMGYEYPPHDLQMILFTSSFLKTFMNICYKYGINGDMTSITTRVELLHLVNLSHSINSEFMKNREWLSEDTIVDELYEYKNLGVLKNYVVSFSSNVEVIHIYITSTSI